MLVACLLIMAGCGNGGDKEAEKSTTEKEKTESKDTEKTDKETTGKEQEAVTIKYYSFSAGADNAEVLEGMIADFEADNPGIKIESEAVGYGEYFTQLATKIASGDAPDCFELNMENFLAYSVRGAVREMDDLFEKTGADKSAYSENVLKAGSFNGKQYAIPLMFSTVVLVYNKDLFDQAGIDYPTKDWTWEDEMEAAKKIRALGDDIYGVFQGIQFWEFYKTVQKNGGSLLSEDGKQFTINSKANIDTLTYMRDRIWEAKVQPNEEERADRGDADLLIEGKLGMFYGGAWMFTDLAKRGQNINWDIQVEPGNTAKACHFFANVGCISNTTKHPEECFKFLNYIASNPKPVKRRIAAQWELPTINNKDLLKEYLEITPPENKAAVFESLDYAVKPPALEQFAELVEIVNPKLEMVRDNLMTPQEALDAAQEEAVASIDLEK